MWRLTLLMIQRSGAVRAVQGDNNFVSSIRRKGNSSNHIIHAVKESRVTYDAGLTIFASDWRVLFSPLMETLKFSPCILSAEAKD
jgi:hypothetical protein